MMHSARNYNAILKLCCSRLRFCMYSTGSPSPVDSDAILSLAAKSQSRNILHEEVRFHPVVASESVHHSLIIRPPDQPANPKLLRVSVLGMPNAGKSTFVNAILGKRVMATSAKIDTTTENTIAVNTYGDTQILFEDTPGILSMSKANRHSIAVERVSRPASSFFEADLGIILADLTSRRVKDGYLQPEILMTMLKNRHVPTILVLNKVDKYKKKHHLLILIHQLTAGRISGEPFAPNKIELVPMRLPKVTETIPEHYDELDLTDEEDVERRLEKSEISFLNKLRHYRGWPHFQDVFVISAKEQKGLDTLRNYMLFHAKPGAWQYHSDVVTDASPKQLILDSVRAGLLQHLPHEIPYRVAPQVTEWREIEDGRLFVTIEVLCGRKSHFNCLVRKCGKIAKESQEHLQDVFFMEVYVQVMPIFIKNFRL